MPKEHFLEAGLCRNSKYNFPDIKQFHINDNNLAIKSHTLFFAFK